ncbi:hypothetical protein L6452_39008 [Arctium lappa]|uniref:Uncharacterized protein n=1 Tax=Arctium lappa TaxID=4217 RepID=A0ACB8XQI4_ARCLA|nr:hypothetical protein L6452_39008 [Arctium lappa]
MASQTTLIKSKNVKFEIVASQLTPKNLGLVDFLAKKSSLHLQYVADFLKASPLSYALKVAPPPSKILLQQFWYTADKGEVTTKQGNKLLAITFQTQHGAAAITSDAIHTILRFPSKTTEGFEALPNEEELIRYQWDFKPQTTVADKRLTKILKAKMPSELNYLFTHIIQCMSRKIGSLDQASKVQLHMGFSVIAGRNIDYAAIIFDDLLIYSPKESDCQLSKVGSRILDAIPVANKVSLLTLRSLLSPPSSASAATSTVLSSAIPAATTTSSKCKSISLHGSSKKAKRVSELSSQQTSIGLVSQQTTLDDFVACSSPTVTLTVSVALTTESILVSTPILSMPSSTARVISKITSALPVKPIL